MNLLGPELVRDLVSLIQRAEADNAYKVLVFKSGDRDYYISHVDLTRIPEYRHVEPCRRALSMISSERRPADRPIPRCRSGRDQGPRQHDHTCADRRLRDSDLFGAEVQNADTQRLYQNALNRGLQTRDAEMQLAGLFSDLGDAVSTRSP
jgi:hypothetical protein